MADVFQLGQEGSKSAFVGALKALQTQGTGVLATLETARLNSLVEFDRRLQAINARRTRSGRVLAPEQAAKFVVSDFSDIDQANTTGTVRADSSTVSLRERAVPAEAVIKTKTFSANKGTIESLDAAQTIVRVHTDDSSTPTGQFDIELVTPLVISQLIIDIVASPSTPIIEAFTSGDGLTFVAATRVAINGYRVNIWLPSQETRFLRLKVTPSHPDDLNGNTFTFGITNFSAQATDYHLRSEMVTKTIQFVPKSQFVVLNAETDPNIEFYLSIFADGGAQAPFIELNPGDAVAIGTLEITTTTTSPSFGGFIIAIPAGTFLHTLRVLENGADIRVAPGLSQDDPDRDRLRQEYVGVIATSVGYSLSLVRADGIYETARTLVVSYVYGPEKVNVRLKIRMSTDDAAVSPVFRGASLDEL